MEALKEETAKALLEAIKEAAEDANRRGATGDIEGLANAYATVLATTKPTKPRGGQIL